MPSHSGTLWLSSSCARYADSRKIRPSAPQRRKERKWLTAPVALSHTFTSAQLKTIQEVITLARTMFLIFKEC
jgi:hypothetical protein